MMITIDVAYKLFMADRETFCADRTLSYYEKNVGFFLDFLYDNYNLTSGTALVDVPLTILKDYICYLRKKTKFENHPFAKSTDEPIKNTTIRTYCRAVKAFLNFCNEEFDTAFRTSVRMPKDDSEEKVPLYIDEVEDIDRLFNLKTRTGLRNYIIVHLMLDAGLRAEEVEGLRICDVMFDKNLIKIVDSKGNKSRVVLMCPKLKKALYNYALRYRQYSDECEDYQKQKDYLHQKLILQLTDNVPINYNVIKQLFSRIKRSTKIYRLTPHLLRHTFATSFIMGGGNLETLRLYLGHYDYSVTRTYLHLANTFRITGAEIYRLDPVFFRTGY